MDCRKAGLLACGLLLLAGIGGCAGPVLGLRNPSPTKEAEEDVVHQASTYVAFADFKAVAGFAKDVPPDTQKLAREEARLSYLKAIEVDAKHLPAHLGLARLLTACEDHAAAAKTYGKALELAGTNAGLWYELGMSQCRQRNWNSAITSLSKAVELAPSVPQYVNHLGLTLARAGRLEEAFTQLSRLHGDAKAHYDLARMLKHMNQPALARKHAEQALSKKQNYQEAHLLLVSLTEQKQPAKAVQTANYTPPGPLPAMPGANPAPVVTPQQAAHVPQPAPPPAPPALLPKSLHTQALPLVPPPGVEQPREQLVPVVATEPAPAAPPLAFQPLEKAPAPATLVPLVPPPLPGEQTTETKTVQPIPLPPLPVIVIRTKSEAEKPQPAPTFIPAPN